MKSSVTIAAEAENEYGVLLLNRVTKKGHIHWEFHAMSGDITDDGVLRKC